MKERQLTLDSALGRKRRDRILDAFEVKAPTWLEQARSAARVLARANGSVTSDQVLEVVGLPPPGMSPKCIGAVFNKSGFKRIGVTQSTRPANHASIIGVWRLKEV